MKKTGTLNIERGELVLRIAKTVLTRSWLVGLVLLALTTPSTAAPVYDGLYVLDGEGNVHTVDGAPFVSPGPAFGWDIARGIALTGDDKGEVTGMYVLSGYGDIFTYGEAPELPGMRPYWAWDIARDIAIAPDYSIQENGISGVYILDGFGGVFPVGDTSLDYFRVYGARVYNYILEQEVDGYVYWGWDVAQDLEVALVYDQDTQAIRSNGYYILDKLGGVHWCLEDENGDPSNSPWGFTQPYFGWDIARAFEMTPTFQGYYLMDGFGNVLAVGDAQDAPNTPGIAALFGWDIARDLELVYDESGYTVEGLVVLDGMGGLYTSGNASVGPAPAFLDDIAKDIELSPFFTFVTDAVVTGP